ncbi:MAG: hypothetical protein KF789_11630 [Bdellovibrionaceae bacterium]|nr:hypothetical protein [Pseudobdellovibrionaceae bacterium]
MTKRILYAVFLTTALFGLVNCAKDGGSGKSTASTPTTCSAGSVYHSSYGCLPTTQCTQMGYGTNYGYYNGQCYAGSANNAVSCQGSCAVGQVQTVYGCMQAATTAQCGSQYTCAGYGITQGSSVPQCVTGITNNNYYGNNYQQQYYNPYQYQQQYYYNPYQYQQQYYNPYGYNNGGLYFYFGW